MCLVGLSHRVLLSVGLQASGVSPRLLEVLLGALEAPRVSEGLHRHSARPTGPCGRTRAELDEHARVKQSLLVHKTSRLCLKLANPAVQRRAPRDPRSVLVLVHKEACSHRSSPEHPSSEVSAIQYNNTRTSDSVEYTYIVTVSLCNGVQCT